MFTPVTLRSGTAALSRPLFSSFFFHNAQWLSQKTSITRSPHTLKLTIHPEIKHAPRSAYKEAEVLTPARLLKVYSQLSKSRLSILVILTSMSGVALSPLPTTVSTLLATAVGTALCSASANTFNQLQEVPFDAQMTRTRMRPLVRRAITPVHAAGFGIATGIAGPAVLWTLVNPTTAILGLSNIALYAGVYTWMKRRSYFNTWVGAIVGAIPPLMGWTACGGQLLPSESYPVHLFPPTFFSSLPVDLAMIDNPLAPFALFMLLFSWQFPHFNPLAHLVRGSYAQAGYSMLSVLDPKKNALVALRHALLLVPICSVLMPLSGLTTWWFAITSLFPNLISVHASWEFWRKGGEKEARVLFRHSLWYLPVMLGLMMIHKQGVDWMQWIGFREEEKDADNVVESKL
ncbi:protoheme ix farnesyltransferase [Moniliophthora roreri MCA 2997]|uniref:Protoheme IX farnesyltransferase, mitochondrial n=2 Tax=Moniliophthora roreri TaxID=221103 RepID=V2XWZ1_MONRO|nr:protoheme ix farnesyltransferase [Moniliophthora roreri MCA 2997]KAI3604925.1 protoheme ix farnesyltransferase [Moniliophthora roreri]